MSEPDPGMSAADEYPQSVGGKGMGVRAMLQAVRNWAKKQKGSAPHFGWETRAQKEAAQQKKRVTEKKREAIDFRSAQQHPPASGVRRLRISLRDPWKLL